MTLLFGALIGIAVGGALAYAMIRRKRPHSLEANLRNFQRGLDALDPSKAPATTGTKSPGSKPASPSLPVTKVPGAKAPGSGGVRGSKGDRQRPDGRV